MMYDVIDEEGNIRDHLTYPLTVRTLVDDPLQHVCFSDTFQKRIKVCSVCDQTRFVKVTTATITGRMIIPVPVRGLVS